MHTLLYNVKKINNDTKIAKKNWLCDLPLSYYVSEAQLTYYGQKPLDGQCGSSTQIIYKLFKIPTYRQLIEIHITF